MNQISLSNIMHRLSAMQLDLSADVQVRTFELFGVVLCQVRYSHVSGVFTVNEYRPAQMFEFDSLDLTAIEIFDTLSELQQTF